MELVCANLREPDSQLKPDIFYFLRDLLAKDAVDHRPAQRTFISILVDKGAVPSIISAVSDPAEKLECNAQSVGGSVGSAYHRVHFVLGPVPISPVFLRQW